MTKYELIHLLIDKVEDFERNAEGELLYADFVGFLTTNSSLEIKSDKVQGGKTTGAPKLSPQVESSIAISQLLVFMSRYAKVYFKKALKSSALKTPEEFGYLASLMGFPGMTKIELIQKNIHERPTGAEIIKRLLEAKLIYQQKSETDSRSQLLYLTEAGRAEFFQLTRQMQTVASIITADLNEAERLQLAFLLKKLDNFHHEIFLNHKEKELEELMPINQP